MAEIPGQNVSNKQIRVPHHKGIAFRKPTHHIGVLLAEHFHEFSRKGIGMARRRTGARGCGGQCRRHGSSPATVRPGHGRRPGHSGTRPKGGSSRTRSHSGLHLDDTRGHAPRYGDQNSGWRRCGCRHWMGRRCDLCARGLGLVWIDGSVFAVLRAIEGLSQRFFMVGGVDGVGHGQGRRCLKGLSRLRRGLESGKVHGPELLAHSRNGLPVLLVTLRVAFLRQNFVQCGVHGILEGGHVHGIHRTDAVHHGRWLSRHRRRHRRTVRGKGRQ